MKVACDNCGASYKIPAEKLTKDVSRATCKKCGAKIVIRRSDSSQDFEDPRLLGGFSEDDAPINHDERTVITPASELGELASGGASPVAGILSEDALGLIGARPTHRSGEDLPVARPAPAPAPAANSALRATQPMAPVSVPQTPPGSSPAVTASASSSAVAPGPAIAASTGRNADVVGIFAKSQARAQAEAQAAAAQEEHSRMPLGLVGVAVLGLLLFLPGGVWSTVPQTVLGFLLALYGVLAALVFHLDVIRSGQVNYLKGVLLPLIPCLILGAFYYLQLQAPPELAPDGEQDPGTAALPDTSGAIEASASSPDAAPASQGAAGTEATGQ